MPGKTAAGDDPDLGCFDVRNPGNSRRCCIQINIAGSGKCNLFPGIQISVIADITRPVFDDNILKIKHLLPLHGHMQGAVTAKGLFPAACNRVCGPVGCIQVRVPGAKAAADHCRRPVRRFDPYPGSGLPSIRRIFYRNISARLKPEFIIIVPACSGGAHLEETGRRCDINGFAQGPVLPFLRILGKGFHDKILRLPGTVSFFLYRIGHKIVSRLVASPDFKPADAFMLFIDRRLQ